MRRRRRVYKHLPCFDALHTVNPAPANPASPYGTLPPASVPASRRPVSLPRLREMHLSGEKITMLTAYDATFAAVADAAGVETILVGDSLGMVCQGLSSTVALRRACSRDSW